MTRGDRVPSRYYKVPLPPPGGAAELQGETAGISTVRRVETSARLVALTFDDGPDETWTPHKLHSLGEFGATATFFVVGHVVDRLPLVTRGIVTAGSEVANHSYSHAWLTRLGHAGVVSELERTGAAILRATGVRTTLFRPPYGDYDSTVLGAAAAAGYRWNVLWDVDPSDYRRPSALAIASHVLSRVQPGSIVVLHDGIPETASALPGILGELRTRGYRCVTVSELLRASQPAPPAPSPGPSPPPPAPKPGPAPPAPGPRPGPSQCRLLQVQTPLMRGDDVLIVQQALAVRRHDPGPLDGVYGVRTAAAVRRFQGAVGLRVTGVVAAEEYRRLNIDCPSHPPSPAPSPEPLRCRTLTLTRPYMRGDDVLAVQAALGRQGLDPGPLDGIYGPLTAGAVTTFQTREGLAANGVVGRTEYDRLGIRCQ
ncbi:MAG: polysaccharide deacetylase family protein [Bacillota bacterium]